MIEVQDVTTRTLTAADRCDRCGAQAYVVTDHHGTELLWCGHHADEHEDKILPFIVVDERSKLTDEPTA